MSLCAQIPRLMMADESLGGKLSGVFTYIPPDAVFPYATLEWGEEKRGLLHTSAQMIVRIWSAYKGGQEVRNLEQRVRDFFDRLSLDPDLRASFKVRQMETIIDSSQVRHVMMRYGVFHANLHKEGAYGNRT